MRISRGIAAGDIDLCRRCGGFGHAGWYKHCLEAICVSPGGIAASACLVFVFETGIITCV